VSEIAGWETLIPAPYRSIAHHVAPTLYAEILELRAELERIKGTAPIGYLYTNPELSRPVFVIPELIAAGWELTNSKWTRLCAVYPAPK
jgi:hypothetical protein